MKRYILSLLVAALASSFVSCEQNDGPFELSSFSDYSLICSEYSWFTSSGNIDIDSAVSFMNLSKGNSNYFWEIQEGCYFLSPDYVVGETDLTPYIIPDQQSYITDTKAYVLFSEAGTFDVRVYNEFDEYVYFDPTPSREDLGLFYEAIYNRNIGKWVTDYSFTLNVVDSADLSFSVWVDGEQIHTFERNFTYDSNSDNWEVIEIDEGDSVVYRIEETNGSPDSISYTVDFALASYTSTAVSSGDEATMIYFATGEFEAGSVTISRSNEYVVDIGASSKTIVIPLIIKVN